MAWYGGVRYLMGDRGVAFSQPRPPWSREIAQRLSGRDLTELSPELLRCHA